MSSVIRKNNTSLCLLCFYREHLIRLQHENKMLKLAQEGSDNEKIALLQSLLEDANRRKNELETENRSAKKCRIFWSIFVASRAACSVWADCLSPCWNVDQSPHLFPPQRFSLSILKFQLKTFLARSSAIV